MDVMELGANCTRLVSSSTPEPGGREINGQHQNILPMDLKQDSTSIKYQPTSFHSEGQGVEYNLDMELQHIWTCRQPNLPLRTYSRKPNHASVISLTPEYESSLSYDASDYYMLCPFVWKSTPTSDLAGGQPHKLKVFLKIQNSQVLPGGVPQFKYKPLLSDIWQEVRCYKALRADHGKHVITAIGWSVETRHVLDETESVANKRSIPFIILNTAPDLQKHRWNQWTKLSQSNRDARQPDLGEIQLLMRQIILAVQYLDEHGIRHRRIKAENIWIKEMHEDKIQKVVLADFGQALLVKDVQNVFHNWEHPSNENGPLIRKEILQWKSEVRANLCFESGAILNPPETRKYFEKFSLIDENLNESFNDLCSPAYDIYQIGLVFWRDVFPNSMDMSEYSELMKTYDKIFRTKKPRTSSFHLHSQSQLTPGPEAWKKAFKTHILDLIVKYKNDRHNKHLSNTTLKHYETPFFSFLNTALPEINKMTWQERMEWENSIRPKDQMLDVMIDMLSPIPHRKGLDELLAMPFFGLVLAPPVSTAINSPPPPYATGDYRSQLNPFDFLGPNHGVPPGTAFHNAHVVRRRTSKNVLVFGNRF